MPLPCNWGWMAGTSTLQPLPCGLEAGLEPGCEPLSWICGKHWSRSCALPMAAPSAASQPCGCSGDHAADGAVRPPRSVPGPCTIPLPPLRLWVGRGCSCAPLSRSCGQLRSGGCVPPMTAPPPPVAPQPHGFCWGCSGDHIAAGAMHPCPAAAVEPCAPPRGFPGLQLGLGGGCSWGCAPPSCSCGQLWSGGCVPPVAVPLLQPLELGLLPLQWQGAWPVGLPLPRLHSSPQLNPDPSYF